MTEISGAAQRIGASSRCLGRVVCHALGWPGRRALFAMPSQRGRLARQARARCFRARPCPGRRQPCQRAASIPLRLGLNTCPVWIAKPGCCPRARTPDGCESARRHMHRRAGHARRLRACIRVPLHHGGLRAEVTQQGLPPAPCTARTRPD